LGGGTKDILKEFRPTVCSFNKFDFQKLWLKRQKKQENCRQSHSLRESEEVKVREREREERREGL
jgi:hypothetical protein